MKHSFNLLERALIEALKDNRKIAHFYEVLLNSKLWLIAKRDQETNHVLSIADVQMMKKGKLTYLPVFSSKYPFEKMLKKETPVCLSFVEIVEAVDENTAILLNPDTPLSKLFIPKEIAMLKRKQNYFKHSEKTNNSL
ncbi:SseB family protein [Priestia megaterium]|nr:SseB family protein [Priestia megaterium]